MTIIKWNEIDRLDECPHCGHEEVTTDEMDFEGDEMWAKLACDRCGGTFFWVYKYSHAEYEEEI